jgi:hypothetical protein
MNKNGGLMQHTSLIGLAVQAKTFYTHEFILQELYKIHF